MQKKWQSHVNEKKYIYSVFLSTSPCWADDKREQPIITNVGTFTALYYLTNIIFSPFYG